MLAPRPPPPGPDGKPPSGPPPLTRSLKLGIVGAVLAAFASNLDTRLTTFALADLRGGFGIGIDEASWVGNAYNVAEIAVVPLTPWLASIISPRRAIALAITLLTLAGAACPSAPSYTWLVGFRFLQGLGGGALIPLFLATLLRFMPLHQRVVGFAFYALVTTATPLLAETVSGLLTELVGWQSVFYLGVLICPVSLLLVLTGLPVEPPRGEGMTGADYPGMLLMSLCASIFTIALDEGQRLDWFSSPLIVTLFVVGGLLLAAFVLWELSIEKPLIDLRLLGRRNLVCGLLMIFPFSLTLLVTSSVVPQYGTQVRGFRELQVGEVLIWAAMAQVGVCALAPFLMRRIDTRVGLACGLALVALGCRLATFIDGDWAVPDLLASSIVVACGQPLVMVGLLLTSTSVLRPQDALSGATLFNVVRTLAGSIGGAIVTGVLTVRERVHSNVLVEHLVTGALPAGAGGPASLAGAARIQATVLATADTYGMLGLVAIGGMLIVLTIAEVRIPRAPA